MFEHWDEFFLLVGSAAAVLIGLIFVVITLMQGRSRETVLAGSKLYMGPIVLGVSFWLVVSAAALTPGITPPVFAAITLAMAAWGLVRGLMSSVGICRRSSIGNEHIHWTDLWFYGVFPSVIYVALGIAAVAIWSDCRWAKYAIAVTMTAGLLLGIRNEWDLITWIAPQSDARK